MFPADEDHMAHALALGRRRLGLTWPNPSVGCVIVARDGDRHYIAGRNVTGRGGRPHAETQAIEQAGASAQGATAYVGLEPCAHHGQTPPCAQALVDAGIARVVYPIDDPDPRVSGKGKAILRANGVEVSSGIGASAARFYHRGFISSIKRARPHVTLKLAVSSDGMIAHKRGEATAITGPLAQARSHLMRAGTDAILVGINTVLIDNPRLTCRLEGLEDRSPVRIIVDTHAQLPLTSKLVAGMEATPVWLLVGPQARPDLITALEDRGVDVIPIALNETGGIDLEAALQALGLRGLTKLLVEGGAQIASAFMNSGLVDEAALFQSPAKIGQSGVPALGDMALSNITNSTDFAPLDEIMLEQDLLTRYIGRTKAQSEAN